MPPLADVVLAAADSSELEEQAGQSDFTQGMYEASVEQGQGVRAGGRCNAGGALPAHEHSL